MTFIWCCVWITLISIHKSGATSERSTVCKYAKNILTMDCKNVTLGSIHDNTYPINSPSLLNLILQNTGLTTLEPNVFSHLPNLTRLDLSKNHLQTLDHRLFTNLTELRNLDIRNNRLISLRDERLFSSQLKLKYLKLANNSLISLSKEVLSPLVSLKYLYLSGNPFVCDCQLRVTMLWCEHRNLSTKAVCHYPDIYNGSSWQILDDSGVCADTVTNSNVISMIVGLGIISLILCVVFVGSWFYCKPLKARSNVLESYIANNSNPKDN
jgi:hypothetical protein